MIRRKRYLKDEEEIIKGGDGVVYLPFNFEKKYLNSCLNTPKQYFNLIVKINYTYIEYPTETINKLIKFKIETPTVSIYEEEKEKEKEKDEEEEEEEEEEDNLDVFQYNDIITKIIVPISKGGNKNTKEEDNGEYISCLLFEGIVNGESHIPLEYYIEDKVKEIYEGLISRFKNKYNNAFIEEKIDRGNNIRKIC